MNGKGLAMLKCRKDELSLHLRIPADRCYLGNALLTLEGICDHFSVRDDSRNHIKNALESALTKLIDLSYQKNCGLFDLKFSMFKDKLQITVEDFMLLDDKSGQDSVSPLNPDLIRQSLEKVICMADEFKVTQENGRHACYSMQFNL